MADEDVTISYGADLSGLRTALGGLRGASQAAGTAVSQAAGAAATGIGTALTSLSGLVIGAGVTGAIAAMNGLTAAAAESVTFLRNSVVAALESEQANQRLANAVKNAGAAFSFTFAELKESASVLQQNSIFSNEQIEAAQKMLVQYKITGEQFRETQTLALNMAADLGREPVQAAKLLAQALSDPEKAMYRLRMAGVTLSASARHQIEELTELGDVYGAQKVLLEDLNRTYAGASAAALDTATGGWQQVQNTLTDLRETIGNAVLPYLKEMVPVVMELVKLFNDWAKAIAAVFGAATGSNLKEFSNWAKGLQLVIRGMRADFAGDGGNTPPSDEEFQRRLDDAFGKGRPGRKGKDGLPEGRGPGGGAFDLEGFGGESIGGVRNAEVGFGSGIADGMVLAMRRSGVLDTLGGERDKDIWAGGGSDARIAALAASIEASVKASGSSNEFKSGFEDSVSTFRRIQSAQLSTEKVEERQLTALEKLVLAENQKRQRDETRNTTLLEISGALKQGLPTVLQ